MDAAFLVVVRFGMDDLPLRLFAEQLPAVRYAAKLQPDAPEIAAAADAIGAAIGLDPAAVWVYSYAAGGLLESAEQIVEF